jgi:hypothetical protein
MSNQRPTFAKREREMKLKDKARAKAERRAAKRAGVRPSDSPDADAPLDIAAPKQEDGPPEPAPQPGHADRD